MLYPYVLCVDGSRFYRTPAQAEVSINDLQGGLEAMWQGDGCCFRREIVGFCEARSWGQPAGWLMNRGACLACNR